MICIGCEQAGECIRANPLDEAARYQALAKEAGSKTALADRLGITPARVSQVIELLRLAPRIQEYIKWLGSEATKKGITEAALRPIAVMRVPQAQQSAFMNLLLKLGLPAEPNAGGTPAQAV